MKKTIIICDDDKTILEVIQIILGDDYNIITCSTENDLHKTLETTTPNLIFLDIWVGESDGRNIIKQLKNKENFKNIPIVLISALQDLQEISDESQAANYLQKPFKMDELITLVQEILQ